MNRLYLALLGLICPLVMVQAQTTIFSDNFETGSLNPVFWTANPAASNGYAGAFNTTNSCGGSHILLLGKIADAGGTVTNSVDLTLDLSGYVDSQLTINFCTWDFYDETNTQDQIMVSNDGGGTFHTLIALTPSSWTNNTWGATVPYDLDKLLFQIFGSVPPSIIIRFQQRGSGDLSTSGDEDGIGFDNFSIKTEKPVIYQAFPYSEDFESGVIEPEWRISSRGAAGQTGPTSWLSRFPSNGISNSTAWAAGSFSMSMGKYSDLEGSNLNARDLYLTMGTYIDSQLRINFTTADFYDESGQYDGIYASEDNGLSFEKIIDYDPDLWYNYSTNAYLGRRVDYDLDKLLKNELPCSCVPDTLVLRFQQAGSGDFNTSGNEDGIFIDDILLAVDPPITYANFPLTEDFESGVFESGWRKSSREAAGQTGPANGLNRFPVNGVYNNSTWGLGNYSLRMNKYSDIEGANLNAVDLYLKMGTFVDSQLLIDFWTADFYDETNLQDGIYASDDHGKSFTKIIDYDPGLWYNYSTNVYYGKRVPYDLDQLLKDTLPCGCVPDTLVLRFQQYGTGDFNTSGDEDGIFIDNLSLIVDPSPTYKNIPYFDGFESGGLGPEWKNASAKALGSTSLSSNINLLTRFQTLRTVNSTGSKNGTYQLRMGKSADIEGTNFNALDLHLNLLGEGNVQLTYWIYEFFDEQQADEGLFISVDAGKTFTQIFNFDLVTVPNNVWTLQTVDISSLAAASSLTLSDSTIIRFQQLGSGDFNTSGVEDGLIFDDITINCTPQTADFASSVDCSTLQVDFTDLTQGTNSTTPFAWDIDGDGQIDTTGNGDLSYIFPGTGTYDVTLYIGNLQGCGDSITKQIFIGSSVPAPSITPVGPAIDLCEGDTITVSAQVGYQGYLWSDGTTTPSIEITTAGSYSVRGLGIDGCYSTPTMIEVTGRPAPQAPFISVVGDLTFCEGLSTDLIAPLGASSYLWSSGATTQTITVSTSGTYGVQIANSFGCLSPTADTMITVLAIPAKPVISVAGGSTWLTSSATGQAYSWFLDGVAIAVDSVSIDGSVFGAGTYTVKVANQDCESDLSNPFVFTLQSLESDWFGSLEIFPNPSSGHFTIKAEQHNARELQLTVYNSLGQQVMTQEDIQAASRWERELDLSAQPNGVYHLRIGDGTDRIIHRLVVRH